MTQMYRSGKHELTSAIFAVLVVALLVLASPVSAVDLSASLPANAAVGESVEFKLGLDLKNKENIPIDNIVVDITGPGFTQTCTFQPDGTPVSGCENLVLSVKKNEADFTNSDNRFGKGWNGAANVNTSFGYGYGFGFKQAVNTELVWGITWNTAGRAAGDYNVAYRVRSSSQEAERDFVLKEPKKIKLQGEKKGTLEECRQAIKDGKLKGTIAPYKGDVIVTNTAGKTFDGGVAVYNKYDENISNQILFDSKNANFKPGDTEVKVKVPACLYQIDVYCGDTLESLKEYPKVQYGDRKIKWSHQGIGTYCAVPKKNK